jgi:hypothetical protein
LIYLVAPYVTAAREWCDIKGVDPESVVIITKEEDAQGCRLGPKDQVIQLPGADPGLFFDLTVQVKPAADIPSNPRLW